MDLAGSVGCEVPTKLGRADIELASHISTATGSGAFSKLAHQGVKHETAVSCMILALHKLFITKPCGTPLIL